MAAKIVTATAISGAIAYETKLEARTHTVIGDEPLEDGGKDMGPRPSEFLCMSLASCTAITLKMYAARKNWDTGAITVKVTRIIEEDHTDMISEIQFEKSLDDATKERMMIVAKKCPIHKILTHPINIETKLA